MKQLTVDRKAYDRELKANLKTAIAEDNFTWAEACLACLKFDDETIIRHACDDMASIVAMNSPKKAMLELLTRYHYITVEGEN